MILKSFYTGCCLNALALLSQERNFTSWAEFRFKIELNRTNGGSLFRMLGGRRRRRQKVRVCDDCAFKFHFHLLILLYIYCHHDCTLVTMMSAKHKATFLPNVCLLSSSFTMFIHICTWSLSGKDLCSMKCTSFNFAELNGDFFGVLWVIFGNFEFLSSIRASGG